MKRISSIVTGSFFTVLIACGGCSPKMNAESESGALFNVPFAFTADGHHVSSGTYEVDRLANPYLISIRNVETGEKQIFTVRPEQQRTIPSKGLLVFHRCGQRKDLIEFHIPGTNVYSRAISPQQATNSEVESCSPADTTTVAAR